MAATSKLARAKRSKGARLQRRIVWRRDRVELHLTIRNQSYVGVWRVIKRAANDIIRGLEHNRAIEAVERAAERAKRKVAVARRR